MDHAVASGMITDWVRDRLSEQEAADIAAHVGTCADCREAAAAARALRTEVGEHGAHLFSPHLESRLLARFVIEPDGLTLEELTACRGHLAACASCAHDAALVRQANAPSIVRILRAWLPARANVGPIATWAGALLALVLIVPAYRGLIELPRTRARLDELEQRSQRTPAGAAGPSSEWRGGGMDLLVLSGPERGRDAAIPEARLAAGQPTQPILIDAEIAPVDSMSIRVLGVAGVVAWEARVARADVWDSSRHALSLLVPASMLSPGNHRLEIDRIPDGRLLFRAGFEIRVREGKRAG